jgi:hypothetical protein
MPRHATADLHQVSVHAAHQHLTHLPLVLVALVGLDGHILGKHQFTQGLLGSLALGLLFLRRINSAQTDFVLGVCGVQDCDGVTVSHRHHTAFNGASRGLECHQYGGGA